MKTPLVVTTCESYLQSYLYFYIVSYHHNPLSSAPLSTRRVVWYLVAANFVAGQSRLWSSFTPFHHFSVEFCVSLDREVF